MVRFQFRTVLAPGRPQRSLAEHRDVVAAIAGGDHRGAERAMHVHLTSVAATLGEAVQAARSPVAMASSVWAT
jgi:DNA-binding FadR family transcriptional regulator